MQYFDNKTSLPGYNLEEYDFNMKSLLENFNSFQDNLILTRNLKSTQENPYNKTVALYDTLSKGDSVLDDVIEFEKALGNSNFVTTSLKRELQTGEINKNSSAARFMTAMGLPPIPDYYETLYDTAERLKKILEINHEGVGYTKELQGNNVNVVQLFNNDNQYAATTIDNDPVFSREQAEIRDLDGSLSAVTISDNRKMSLYDRHEEYMYDPIRFGIRLGASYMGLVSPTSDKITSMLYNMGFLNTNVRPNIYSGQNGSSYVTRFYNSFDGGSFVSDLNESNLISKAQRGFNAGQVMGYEYFNERSSNLNDVFIPQNEIDFINLFFDYQIDSQIDSLERLRVDTVKAYEPGLSRINQPFLAKAALNDLLLQNNLQPAESPGNFDNGDGDLRILFRSLYINSRTKGGGLGSNTRTNAVWNDFTRITNGWIAGVPINDIQRQASKRTDGPSPPNLFTFGGHDDKFLRNDQLERGYKQNISGNIGFDVENDERAGGFLTPALRKIEETTQSKIDRSYGQGKTQFFPFLIETENKTVNGLAENVECYFQALINSLDEQAVPNWQPKHFFGRTEQIQTYISTERTINLSFNVYADTMHELANLKHRVNFLIQQTYGQYNSSVVDDGNKYITAGPIVRLTLGDLYSSLPGIITNININWNGPGGSSPNWEMTRGLMMPWICSINLGYKVMHEDPPSRGSDFYPRLQYGIDGNHQGDGSDQFDPDKRLIPQNNEETFTVGGATYRRVPGIDIPQSQG